MLMLYSVSVRADICEAVRYERVDRVQAYLAADTNAANFVGEKQYTPLHWAAEHSSSNGIQILKLLLAHGAKVDAKNHIDQTPLVLAAIYNNPTGARILIAHGAKVDERSGYGMTPLHYAARDGCFDVAAVLVASHADVNAKCPDGTTVLLLAYEGRQSAKSIGDTNLIERCEKTVAILREAHARK